MPCTLQFKRYHSSGTNPKRTGAASIPRTGRKYPTSVGVDDAAAAADELELVVLVARIN